MWHEALAGAAGTVVKSLTSQAASSSSSNPAAVAAALASKADTLLQFISQQHRHDSVRRLEEAEGGELSNKVLTAVEAVAAELEPAWQLTQEVAQQRLEHARAAATRSCAYLACANLALEGGPAAGEGKGSLRCGGCKTAWYCGTACSHADWRVGGHRRVC
jgi:hypothetical protein